MLSNINNIEFYDGFIRIDNLVKDLTDSDKRAIWKLLKSKENLFHLEEGKLFLHPKKGVELIKDSFKDRILNYISFYSLLAYANGYELPFDENFTN